MLKSTSLPCIPLKENSMALSRKIKKRKKNWKDFTADGNQDIYSYDRLLAEPTQ